MLSNKNAVITGGGRGIGRAIAIEFAKNGASVALIYGGNKEAAENTAEEIRGLGVRAEIFRCDVSCFDEAKRTVDEILKEFTHIDILVNNAGITRDGLLLSMDEDSFSRVLDINLKGSFNMIRHLYSHMMKQRKGRIINISSVSGLMGNPGQANYSSAKAGIIGLTKTVAKELAGRNVTCNAIAPGFIETDMTGSLSEKIKESAMGAIPLKRMGKPEEVAKLAAFLASDDSSYITGEVIKIDGGLYI
ncbi:MAG TPA: 3-oxoacyl-[acyl-carrier-protein] reductase [Bacillota bacterium]|jgi:3-oxoacyl-[acyl-carrier protein] reductase|nr:3-oxoacyl-[acyl-carrier-protein] reductase [Bacillota bacterium]